MNTAKAQDPALPNTMLGGALVIPAGQIASVTIPPKEPEAK